MFIACVMSIFEVCVTSPYKRSTLTNYTHPTPSCQQMIVLGGHKHMSFSKIPHFLDPPSPPLKTIDLLFLNKRMLTSPPQPGRRMFMVPYTNRSCCVIYIFRGIYDVILLTINLVT